VLFVATMLALVVVRIELGRRGMWPADVPAPPWGIAVSTVLLGVSSVTMQKAASDPRMLRATLALGVGFLLVQAACWLSWSGVIRAKWDGSEEWRLALTAFYVLTGLHAAHVVGGLLAIALAIARPAGAARVRFCALYWHFLGVVWLVIVALLLVWR
jgi:cytochrome c oxidase subunit 3